MGGAGGLLTPNLALQRTPHRRRAIRSIIAYLGGAGPLSFVVRPTSDLPWGSAGLGLREVPCMGLTRVLRSTPLSRSGVPGFVAVADELGVCKPRGLGLGDLTAR